MNVFVVIEQEQGGIENVYAFDSLEEAEKKAGQIKTNWKNGTGPLVYEVPVDSNDGSTCQFCDE